MDTFFEDIKSNPLILAVMAVLFVIGVVLLHKQVNNATSSATPASTAPTVPSGPPVTYNQTYNQYPVTTPPVQTPSTPSTPVTPSPPASAGGALTHVGPAPKGTSGMSDNFWVYAANGTTDTITSVNAKAGWSKYGPGYLVGYRNNAEVLQSWGVDLGNYNSILPAGLQLSL